MLNLPVIDLIEEGGQLRVRSPYHPAFRTGAKQLGGRWDPKRGEWVFDARLRSEVRDLLIRVYGWDGTYPVRVADVRVILDRLPKECQKNWRQDRSLWLLGRELAYRPARDAEVKPGPGVSVKAGGFPPSGGSRKYPALEWEEGTILQVLDVPVAKIQAAREKLPEAIEVLPGSLRDVLGPDRVIPVVDSEMPPAVASPEPAEEVPAGRWQVACPACGLFPFKGQGPAGGMGPCPQGCGRIAVFLPLPEGS
jgi:hypothetical protein